MAGPRIVKWANFSLSVVPSLGQGDFRGPFKIWAGSWAQNQTHQRGRMVDVNVRIRPRAFPFERAT